MELRAATLQELLELRATQDDTWLVCPANAIKDASAERFSFGDIIHSARLIGSALLANGAVRNESVGLIADNGPQFVMLFLGISSAGLVPVPLHLPFLASPQHYSTRIRGVLSECRARFLVTEDSLAGLARELTPENRCRVLTCGELLQFSERAAIARCSPSDLAFVQYSSGSTRNPRGAMLTHRNVLSNIHAIGLAIDVSADDVALCWLPLFHDMGLTGTLLYSLYWKQPLVLMTPFEFITRPASWLWAICRFGVTGCAAPNFAYALCTSRTRVPNSQLDSLDLTTWRHAINGAEAVQKGTVDAFVARFAPYGFDPSALLAAYGLAENTVACCFSRHRASLQVDRVNRRTLESGVLAQPAGADTPARELISVGTVVAGHELRIVRSSGGLAGDREVGEIQVRGESTMKGYLSTPQDCDDIFAGDGWLRTGDLGYLAEGLLYVVGREKEIIKQAGAKYDAADIQSIVCSVPNVRKGCAAAFALPNEIDGTENLIVLAETKLTLHHDLDALRSAIATAVHQTLLVRPRVVGLICPGVLPKSTSGKIRNAECRLRYERGELPLLLERTEASS